MSQPSSQDFLEAFDPTGYNAITGAQLLQYITGAAPFTDKGMVVISADTPRADTTTKWQNYIWIQIVGTAVSVYVWNPTVANPDTNLLNWQSMNTAGIAAGSIQGYQIASNTITDANMSAINGINASKIVGLPNSVNKGDAAGPTVLSGTYPDPSIKNGGVTSAMIAQNAVKGGATNQLGTGANGVDVTQNIAIPAASTLGSPTGSSGGAPVANDRLVVDVGATAYATVRKVLDALAEPAIGQALNVVQVNSAGTGFQYANSDTIGRILQKYCESQVTAQNTATNLAITGTAPTTGNTTKCTIFGAAGVVTFTPISASSKLKIQVTLQMSNNGSAQCFFVLFNSTTALGAASSFISGNTQVDSVTLTYEVASPGISAQSFAVYFAGSAGTTYINSSGATNTGVAAILTSSIEITEYI